MVCYQNQSLRKVKFNTTRCRRFDLTSNRRITTDSHRRGAPDMGHDRGGEGEILLGHCHPGIVPLAIEEIERSSQELGYVDATEQTKISPGDT